MTPDAIGYTPDLVIYYAVRSVLILIAIRDTVRKGIALRKSAGRREMVRFICLLIFNTVGILPMIYIFFFSNKVKIKKEEPQKIKHTEGSIEETIKKVEKVIKKNTIPTKKPVAKKASAKKPVAKKTLTKKTK